MKSTALIATAFAIGALAASTACLAEGPDWDQVGYPGTPAQQRQWDLQRQQQAELESESRMQGPQYNPRWQQYGAGPRYEQRDEYRRYGQYARDHRFRRGDYVTGREWRDAHFVHDWRAHRLAPPTPGYGWVQADTGDYLLIALATGLVANVLMHQ